MKYALINGDIFTGSKVLNRHALIIDGPRIVDIVEEGDLPQTLDRIDVDGWNIAPGFMDLQVNGGGGVLFNDAPTLESIEKIAAAHLQFGTTSLLPTVITADTAVMKTALRAVKEAHALHENQILGVHFEGPYLSPKKAGVHDRTFIREASDEEIGELLSLSDGAISLWTVAPESVEVRQVKKLAASGIRVSLGHTDASYQVARDAFAAGARGVTHLFNAMSAFESRRPGVVGAALDAEDVWAGIIADGFHVDFAAVRVACKLKRDKLFLVTDAMPPVGSSIEGFRLGHLEIKVVAGKCETADGTLAGSVLDMASAVRNMVQKVGIPLPEALRMASLYPARFVGVDNRLGMIAPNYVANLVVFNNQLAVKAVVLDGVMKSFL